MSNLMQAAVFHGVRDVRIEDVPRPTAGPGEVVLRVQRCSVCGTDKRIFTHGQKNVVPPAITGHEIVGTVYEIGSGVNNGLRIGQEAVVATVVGCGKCIYCQRKQYNLCDSFTAIGYDYAGGFAELCQDSGCRGWARQRHSHSPNPCPWTALRWLSLFPAF